MNPRCEVNNNNEKSGNTNTAVCAGGIALIGCSHPESCIPTFVQRLDQHYEFVDYDLDESNLVTKYSLLGNGNHKHLEIHPEAS